MNGDAFNIQEIRQPLTEIQRKRWRVYYNCREHFPHLVAVDNGSIQSQVRVQTVTFVECDYLFGNTDMGKSKSLNLEIAQRKGKQNEPSWWIELDAYAVFENGSVVFHGRSHT
jgi:hypothetical protein